MKNYDILMSTLDSMVQPISLRTNDTNTRVKNKSIDVILELWMNCLTNINQKYIIFLQDTDTSISTKISNILMDSKQGEKSIQGRINTYSRRIQDLVNSDEEGSYSLTSKPHQVLLGSNYKTIIEFAINWWLHKNTNIRQSALKLIVDLCKFNLKDPNGASFKPKIVSFILGLKPSLRDPLIKKINSVCKTIYINAEELGVDIALKSNKKDHSKLRSQDRGGDLSSYKRSVSMPRSNLPEINAAFSENSPTQILPYYEPMKDDIKFKYQNAINIFNENIIGCFVSQTWSNRQAAIDKIVEQLPNFDDITKDSMKWEINKFNLPIEEWFSGFWSILLDGVKDPVLKIYLSILDLIQQGLPLFTRRLPRVEFNNATFENIIKEILKKTSDLKLKIRDASKNIWIYLSHQPSIGAEKLADLTIEALKKMYEPPEQRMSKTKSKFIIEDKKSDDAETSLWNSTMWSWCLSLLNDFQKQAQLAKVCDDDYTVQFMDIINASLRHHTPAVRKEAELLFIELYKTMKINIEVLLKDQKPQVIEKLIDTAKKEAGIVTKTKDKFEEEKKSIVNTASTKLNNAYIPENIIKIFGDEVIETMKSANPKNRIKALAEIKKIITKITMNLSEK